MTTVTYGAKKITLLQGESVLEALLRSSVSISHSCRAGACQSCVLRSTTAPPPSAQAGLKENQKVQNLFFSCLCRPEEDLEIDINATPKEQAATIIERSFVCSSVLRLRLQTKDPFPFYPGQFLQLRREDGLTRSYSIASVPSEGFLELHIRIVPNGQMTNWLASETKVGDPLYVRGPTGDCFYTEGKPEQPILMIGVGTGLAPLYGVVRTALSSKHTGPIHFLHGTTSPEHLYYTGELQQLKRDNPNLQYQPYILNGEATAGVLQGDLLQVVKQQFKTTKGWRVFICGDPALVNALKKWAFLAGAAMKEILADSFIMSPQ